MNTDDDTGEDACQDDGKCQHATCATSRELSARISGLIQHDILALPLVMSIMALEDVSFAEALLIGMEPLRQAMIQILSEDEAEALDSDLKGLLDGQ